jgi:hypothetical protein
MAYNGDNGHPLLLIAEYAFAYDGHHTQQPPSSVITQSRHTPSPKTNFRYTEEKSSTPTVWNMVEAERTSVH